MAERTVVQKIFGKWLLRIVLAREKFQQLELVGFSEVDAWYRARPVVKDRFPMTPDFIERRNRRVEVAEKCALHINRLAQTRNGAHDTFEKRLHGGEDNIGPVELRTIPKIHLMPGKPTMLRWKAVSTPSCQPWFNVADGFVFWRVTIDEEGPDHRCHRPGWFLPGRVIVGERL